jgi:hypothetical protein
VLPYNQTKICNWDGHTWHLTVPDLCPLYISATHFTLYFSLWPVTQCCLFSASTWCHVTYSINSVDMQNVVHSPYSISFLSLAPQPGLGLGLLHKIWLNFSEASQQFSYYRVGLLAPCQTPILEDQAYVFISPRGRVATHFSCLLWHAWFMVGLFLFPGHHMGSLWYVREIKYLE